MTEATPELKFEVLGAQTRPAQVDGKIDEVKQEIQALRTSQDGIRQEITGIHQEMSAIHATLVRHEGRLDRTNVAVN